MKIRSLLVLFLLLLLAACSNNNEVEQAKGETVEEKAENGEKKVEEKPKVEFPEASTDPMEIVQQSKGVNVDEAISLMESGDAAAWEELLRDFNAKRTKTNRYL